MYFLCSIKIAQMHENRSLDTTEVPNDKEFVRGTVAILRQYDAGM